MMNWIAGPQWWARTGGDSGTRTRNLRIANAALSQLSYIPTLRRRLLSAEDIIADVVAASAADA